MKVGEIIETQQPGIHKKLNKKRKHNKKKSRGGKEENLSFNDIMELMQHDSYCRGRGGSIKQKTWAK